MSAPKDGGSAFPAVSVKVDRPATILGVDLQPGLSVRDYFATHAPDRPAWFQPVMPAIPPQIWEEDGGTRQFKTSRDAENAVGENFHDKNADARAEWEAERLKQLEFQWPWFYADQMLAARAKESA